MAPMSEIVLDQSLTLLEALRSSTADDPNDIVQSYLRTCFKGDTFEYFGDVLEWFNVSRPLCIQDLLGKITVLDFFTYCCINCLHVLPTLKCLEKKIPASDGLVIIGVHSPKFMHEKDAQSIQAALARYNISHPVVNDANGLLWNTLGIAAWPTMVVLGPDAAPVLLVAGEHYMPQFTSFIEAAVQFYNNSGALSPRELPMAVHRRLPATGPLLFPGKVAFCEAIAGSRLGYLAIADTGHHRIVVCRDYGEVEYIIGGHERGFTDGEFTDAKFSDPQGVTFNGSQTIYVADTGNNAIRKIDLEKREVTTLVGKHPTVPDGDASSAPKLSSPWDLCMTPHNNILLIAAAGSHQLWAYAFEECVLWRKISLAAYSCKPVAGTGKEENRNNSYPHAAAFAQPSGICVSRTLNAAFVADSESSSIRQVNLETGQVMAVVGGNKIPTDLFCFGDTDGQLWDVRLQHPLGVSSDISLTTTCVYVADTYNHKLKIIWPEEKSCDTLLVLGTPGDTVDAGIEEFNEPGGLCVCAHRLFVADTNNHRIKEVDLRTNMVRSIHITMKFQGEKKNRLMDMEVETIVDTSGALLKVNVEFDIGDSVLPDGVLQWNLELPSNFGWLADSIVGYISEEPPYQLEHPVTIVVPPGNPGQVSELSIVVTWITCSEDNLVCNKRSFTAGIRVRQATNAQKEVRLNPKDFRQHSAK